MGKPRQGDDAKPPAFRLRAPARVMLRIAPIWMVLVGTACLVVSALLLSAAIIDDRSAGMPLPVAVLVLAGFWTFAAWLWRPQLSLVRQAHQRPDGVIEVVTIFGRKAVIARGDVAEVGERLFIPQPGSTRLRTHRGQTFYFWGFEDKYELVNRLHALQK